MDFLQLQRVQSSLGGARVLMQRLLLLQSTSSKYTGFSVLKLHSTWDIPAPKIKPCVGRWTHNQWITREDLYCRLFILAILINKKWCLVVLIGFFLKLVTSCCAFTHRVTFEGRSGPRVLLKRTYALYYGRTGSGHYGRLITSSVSSWPYPYHSTKVCPLALLLNNQAQQQREKDRAGYLPSCLT